MSELTNKQLAEVAVQFIESDLGKQYLQALSTYYNSLHHEAEKADLSIERKAMSVERAAGVHWAIDWLLNKKQLLEQGFFDDKPTS